MNSFSFIHKPVLLKEVLYFLDLKQGDVIFEGTLGGAGHTVEIIKAIAPTGKLIGVDLDSQAISTATKLLKKFSDNVVLVRDNFTNIKDILRKLDVEYIDGFFLDLGLSLDQIERSKRGFSYIRDEKLDMRFDSGNPKSAYGVVNEYPEEKLREIFYTYGEEKWAARIAKNIVEYRKLKKIESTGELVEIIKKSIPYSERYKRGHPAKRVFQAIRIEVNDELENLEKALEEGFRVLKSGGRMVVISYHSLEDRIVKQKFSAFSGKCICPPGLPVCTCGVKKQAEIITKKVVTPSKQELEENPHSRSAKLRAIEKV